MEVVRRPGHKRLLITATVLLNILLGIPVWWQLTKTHRAPLPYKAIKENSLLATSEPLKLPRHLEVILLACNPENLGWVKDINLERLTETVIESLGENGNSNSSFTVHVSIKDGEGCGISQEDNVNSDGMFGTIVEKAYCLAEYRICNFFNDLESDQFDDWYDEFSRRKLFQQHLHAGVYQILVVDKKTDLKGKILEGESSEMSESNEVGGGGEDPKMHVPTHKKRENLRMDGKVKAVIGKYRHAWIETVSFNIEVMHEKVIPLAGSLANTFFDNGGHKISPKEARKKGEAPYEPLESLPLSADGRAILSFSLLNSHPEEDWLFDWDFAEIERRFLEPMLESLSPVAELSVESQVLYYTPKAADSPWNPLTQSYEIPVSNWPYFVNANEWNLDTSLGSSGRSKILHFVVYIPGKSESPLRLRLSSGRLSPTNAFTSFGWGGVLIYNPDRWGDDEERNSKERERRQEAENGERSSFKHRKFSAEDLKFSMQTVVAQVRTLFGLSGNIGSTQKSIVEVLPAVSTGFAEWEVDNLLRKRVVEDYEAASATLDSLSKLVKSLPNMVIKPEIGVDVLNTLKDTQKTRSLAQSSGGYEASAFTARMAHGKAENAFLDPKMMSLLYFPFEHHMAVYTPFFVPVFLHSVLSFMKELFRFIGKWRKYKLFVDNHC